MEKTSKIFVIFSYIYILLPILMFFLGWCNLLIAIVGTLVILVSLYFCIKNAKPLWIPNSKKGWIFLLAVFLISLIWVISSGIGAWVFQNDDHNCRNAVFELLTFEDWPVIISSPAKSYVLTYYIAFWLPSALVAKIFQSPLLGYNFQILWASIGIFLVFYYILNFLKKKSIFPILVFIFFSGLDIIGAYFTDKSLFSDSIAHLEWYFDGYQFSSFTTQLYWVFNQAIPAWIITLVILKENSNKNILLFYACAFISCTLPAIGMFPIVLYCLLRNGAEDNLFIFKIEHIKSSFKNLLTFQNIAGFLSIFTVSAIYLLGNISGGTKEITVNDEFNLLKYVFLFFGLEVGIYMLLIWNNFKKNPLYYISLLCFLIYPFIHVGSSCDFCMRATIPALIILYLFVVKIFDEGFDKNKIVCPLLLVVLLVASVTPIHEMNRTIRKTLEGKTKIQSRIDFKNFFAYAEDNIFLKYLSKRVE